MVLESSVQILELLSTPLRRECPGTELEEEDSMGVSERYNHRTEDYFWYISDYFWLFLKYYIKLWCF